jgi:hypothetical protein
MLRRFTNPVCRSRSNVVVNRSLTSVNQRKINLMADLCEHLQYLTATDFPSLKAPVACQECLAEGTRWWRCGNAGNAVMSVVATRRLDGMLLGTSAARGTR